MLMAKVCVHPALLVLLVCGACAELFNFNLDANWETFKETFNKTYASDEESARRAIWQQNVEEILQHNLQYDLGIQPFRKGLNEWADMSHHELLEKLNGHRRPATFTKCDADFFFAPSNVTLPDEVDWRTEGFVTPVKNQGDICRACWAFSTTGALEGQLKKKTGELTSLSEQNLIDCSRPQGNNGCLGGWLHKAFDYVKQNTGIDLGESYPYTGKQDGACHYNASTVGATCVGYANLPYGDEFALQEAVATVGPISVYMDASHANFHLYQDGIYVEPNCSSVFYDHAVLVVGYGSEKDQDYWLVKNSWGTSWGIEGYAKMARNKNNQCGLATQAIYPLM